MNNSEQIVIAGVGKAFLPYIDNGISKVLTLGTLQDMKLSFSGSFEKVYGGDGLAPIYLINKDTTQTVSFTNAKFGLEHLKVSLGATLSDTGTCIFNVAPTLIATGTSFTVPGALTTIDPTTVIAQLSDDADGVTNVSALTYVASPTSLKDGQFSITAAGVVTLGGTVTNKYLSLNGLYNDTKSSSASVTTASVPSYIMVRHVSNPYERSDGKHIVLHTIVYRAKSTGKLDIDQKRQAASAPVMEFEAFDAGRTDGAVIVISKQLID